ncbi:1-phosphofructokinase [Halarchaeum nitratireducens]|uniref:1-phosphofructokinase n=1 Tax=Halarchaeum nitratireducens TaxID=489913 RepID=A0A830G8S7_9EURY|nr:1-phosphofructokinase [Halarchaeum nitratireducens]MBP2250039.1 1-phosphofructokinase [Halarchaeum solikamskense]GGN08951.1 1-phosphofructokinase [Halarchaeum nitratireducens]
MILTVTPNPALDYTVALDEPLDSGAVVRTSGARVDAGGKGINVSQYLRALGSETAASGFLGDPFGRVLADELDDAGLETAFVTVDESTRLNQTILAPDGEYKINQDGPRVSERAVEDLLARVRELAPPSLVVGGSLPPGVRAADVDRLAAAGDWATTVDVGGEMLAELESEYALCKPNREELAAATGMATASVDDCIAAAEALRETGYERVIASLGGDGAVLVGPRGAFVADALDVDVVDTVGAGDSLLAGVLAAYDDGADDATALAQGVAVSSRVVGVAGTSVPDLDEIAAVRDDVRVRRH